jgi:hypothetical protein
MAQEENQQATSNVSETQERGTAANETSSESAPIPSFPILGIDFGSAKCVMALSVPNGKRLPQIISHNLSNDQTP